VSDQELRAVSADLVLKRLYCQQASFTQVFVPSDAEPPRPGRDFQVGVRLEAKELDEDEAGVSVRLTIRLEPEPEKDQPYDVLVSYVGEFTLGEALAGLEKADLVRTNCAAILFPYVRERVTSLTSHGTNGPLVVPTMNVGRMVREAEIDAEDTAEAEAAESGEQ